VLASAALAGILAAATLTFDRPGLDWPLVGLALAGTAVAGRAVVGPRPWRGASLARYAWAAGALALLGVGVVRAAGWLYVWCVLLAIVAGAQALVGGRTVRAAVASVCAVPIAMARALPWARYGLGRLRPRTGMAGPARLLASLAVGLVLLLVFGALFASADPAFGQLVDRVMPSGDFSHLPRWVLLFTLVGSLGLGTGYLASTRPAVEERNGDVSRRLRRLEWALPIALVDGLFATFVVVQLAVLFGGHRHVLETAGLTYAEYARGGFWQLLVVTGLTLAVMAVAGRWAPRVLPADRLLIRVLLGGLAALTLVIVWSALRRMSLYEQAYGYTRLRVFVTGVELWLGLLFVMIMVAGFRLRARWLPRAALAAAVVGMLGLAVLNPDRFIAARNVDRYQQTGRIDLDYLSELSADAVPEMARLPEPLRSCVLWRTTVEADDWRTVNIARSQARPIIKAGADERGCFIRS
jgi:hypothetical protein